jgi:primosomal protein N' (replication factor Y)
VPDFRNEERTFQLIAQVAGRAGRSDLPGRVVVQTRNPDQPAILLAVRGDYAAMARHIEAARRETRKPPFTRLCRVLFEGKDAARCDEVSKRWHAELARLFGAAGLDFVGPEVAPLSLLRGKHRWHLLLVSAPDAPVLERALGWMQESAPREARVDVKIDVDPASTI